VAAFACAVVLGSAEQARAAPLPSNAVLSTATPHAGGPGVITLKGLDNENWFTIWESQMRRHQPSQTMFLIARFADTRAYEQLARDLARTGARMGPAALAHFTAAWVVPVVVFYAALLLPSGEDEVSQEHERWLIVSDRYNSVAAQPPCYQVRPAGKTGKLMAGCPLLKRSQFTSQFAPPNLFVDAAGGNDVIELRLLNSSLVAQRMLIGGYGNDEIYNESTKTAIMAGEEGDDIIEGGTGDDEIWGDYARSVSPAISSNDSLSGGPGRDMIFGWWGNDLIMGDSGDDSFHPSDRIPGVSLGQYAGFGDTALQGGLGTDVVIGGTGRDTMSGNGISDTVLAKESDFGESDEADPLIDCGSDSRGLYRKSPGEQPLRCLREIGRPVTLTDTTFWNNGEVFPWLNW